MIDYLFYPFLTLELFYRPAFAIFHILFITLHRKRKKMKKSAIAIQIILASILMLASTMPASGQCKAESQCVTPECRTDAEDSALKDVRYTSEDLRIFDEVIDSILPFKALPMRELMVKTAMQFLGTPYVAYTLEIEPERLTVNLRETDCILFVEMCLSLALTAKSGKPDFETYCNTLRGLRYKDGVVDGYPSRNHYTSAWIRQGEKNGIMKDISRDLGGTEYEQTFSFMSSHPQSYRQLKDHPELIKDIRKTERSLDGQYWYLPKKQLARSAKGIKDGDIICYCYDGGKVPGLDIAHVTIAYHTEDGTLTFIHASSADHKVEINDVPVIPYVNGMKSQSGIRVLRLNN